MNSELLPLKRNLSELSVLLNPESKLLQFSELLGLLRNLHKTSG